MVLAGPRRVDELAAPYAVQASTYTTTQGGAPPLAKSASAASGNVGRNGERLCHPGRAPAYMDHVDRRIEPLGIVVVARRDVDLDGPVSGIAEGIALEARTRDGVALEAAGERPRVGVRIGGPVDRRPGHTSTVPGRYVRRSCGSRLGAAKFDPSGSRRSRTSTCALGSLRVAPLVRLFRASAMSSPRSTTATGSLRLVLTSQVSARVRSLPRLVTQGGSRRSGNWCTRLGSPNVSRCSASSVARGERRWLLGHRHRGEFCRARRPGPGPGIVLVVMARSARCAWYWSRTGVDRGHCSR